MDNKGRSKMVKIIIAALLVAAAVVISAALLKPSVYTVGKSIKVSEITEFYFTRASSANPPYYRRYRIYNDNGKYMLYHEKREGDAFPLTEKNITSSGSLELGEEEKRALFECLDGGTVKKRSENTESGDDGPWTYLYWTGDKGKYQAFTFASVDKKTEFESLCEELKNSK